MPSLRLSALILFALAAIQSAAQPAPSPSTLQPTPSTPSGYNCSSSSNGEFFTSQSGVISSDFDGTGNSTYGAREFCTWTVLCPKGTVWAMRGAVLFTERNYDHVKVYNFTGGVTGQELWSESGQHYDIFWVSYVQSVRLRFTSDGSVQYAGFSIPWVCDTPANLVNFTNAPLPTGPVTPAGCPAYPGQLFHQLNGSIRSDTDGHGPINYGNRERCYWNVVCPPNSGFFNVIGATIDVEQCCDVISIYRGNNTDGPLLFTRRGSYDNVFWSTNETSVFITFITDSSVTRPGFTLPWRCGYASPTFPNNTVSTPNPVSNITGCSNPSSGTTWTQVTSGTLTSDFDGHGPGNYANRDYCYWSVSCPDGVFSITGATIRTESCCDRVYLRRGIGTNGSEITQWRGNHENIYFATNESRVTIVFTADGSVTHDGFTIPWSCGLPTNYTNTTPIPSAPPGGFTCSSPSNGSSYTGNFFGTIESDTDGHSPTSGSTPYGVNERCTWWVHCPAGYVFSIQGMNMDTERTFDDVQVYDTYSNILLWERNGRHTNLYFTSASRSVRIFFQTDGSITGGGFTMPWACADPRASTTAPAWASVAPQPGGTYCTVNDGIMPAPGAISINSAQYTHNLYCSWTVTCDPGAFFRIDSLSGVTESCCDFLEMNDAYTGVSLFRYSGPMQLRAITSNVRAVSVSFRSDASVAGPGFVLQYSCTNHAPSSAVEPAESSAMGGAVAMVSIGIVLAGILIIAAIVACCVGHHRSKRFHRSLDGAGEGDDYQVGATSGDTRPLPPTPAGDDSPPPPPLSTGLGRYDSSPRTHVDFAVPSRNYDEFADIANERPSHSQERSEVVFEEDEFADTDKHTLA